MLKTKDRTSSSTKTGSSKEPGNRGGRCDRSQADSDNEGESELLALQRTYLRLEAVKRAEERESQEIIRRQRLEIGSLTVEREELMSSLTGFLPVSNKRDRPVARAVHDMHLQSDDINGLVAQEKNKLAGLEREIRDTLRKIDKERRGSTSKDDPARKIQKLTTQLEKAHSRFSSVVSTNGTLRQDIETMRGERQKFLQLHNKLQTELLDTRREKRTVLEEAIEHMNVREEAGTRVLRSHDQWVKDDESHAGEAKELLRELSHAQKTERFLEEKTKARGHDKGFIKAKEKRELQERETKVEQQVQLNEYEVAKEKIGDIVARRRTKRRKVGSQHGGGAVDRSAPTDGIDEEEDRRRPFLWETVGRRRSTLVGPAFRAAAGWAGEAAGRRGRRLTEHRRRSTVLLPGLLAEEQERLRELAQRALDEERRGRSSQAAAFDAELFYSVYMEGEDENFALFNYVLEQSRTIEELAKDLEQLKRSIKLQEKTGAAQGHQSRGRAAELVLERQRAAQASGQLQTDVEKYQRILSLVKTGVEAMATAAGVDHPGHVIGGEWTDDTVTRAVLSLLGQTELKLTEQLAARYYQTHMDTEKTAGKLSSIRSVLGMSSPHMAQNDDIQLPFTSLRVNSEVETSDEEELRPLSRDELRQRALNMMASKAGGARTSSHVRSPEEMI